MSADKNTQSTVEDFADLEVQESEQIVGGDMLITKKVDKSSPVLHQTS